MITDQDSVVGSVIQMVLFEDVLATSIRTTPVVNLAPLARSHPNPGVGVGVQLDLFQSNIDGPNGHAEFRATPEGQGH